jgi:hypothetical protein
MNTRLLRLVHMRLKPITPPPVDFHIQSVPGLIDQIVPILNEQPNLVIGTSCVLACKV